MAALEQAGLKWLHQNLQPFIRGAEQGSEAMEKVGDTAEQSSTKTSILTGAITGVATAITTAFIGAVTKAAQAVVGLASESVALAGEFQGMASRLTIAAGAAGAAADEFGGLSEVSLAVGGDTRLMGVSATGAAGAMTELLKAGIPLEDVMGNLNNYMEEGAELGGILRASIDLAAATELDMVRASGLASKTMAQFGIDAQEVTGIMDYFVRAADASVADVGDIEMALQNAGPVLSGFGFSAQEAADQIALLSNVGIEGAEAGTALKSMWTEMTKQSDKVTGALESQGIALTDAEGSYLDFEDILVQLEMAMMDMTEAQKAEFAQTIAGSYGKNALLAIVNQGTEGYYEYAAALETAAGIEVQAGAKAETFAGQQEALEGTLETLRIRIGSALLPVLTDLMTTFSGFVDRISPLVASAFETIGTTASGLFGYFKILFTEGDSLNDFLTHLPEPLQPIVQGFGEFYDRLVELKPMFDIIKNALGQIFTGDVESGLLQIQLLIQETFGRETAQIFNRFREFVLSIPATFQTVKEAVMPFINIIGNTLVAAFQTIATEVWPVLKEAFAEIKAAFVDAGLIAEDKSTSLKDVLTSVAKGIVLAVGIITGVIKGIAEVIKVVAQIFRSQAQNFKVIIDNIKEWFENLGMLLKTKSLAEALPIIGKMFKNILKIVKAFGKSILTAFLTPFKIIGKFVKGFVDGVIKLFKDLAKKLVGGSVIPDMMEKIFDVITDVMDAIANFIDDILDTIVDIFERALALVVSVVKSALEKVESIFKDVMDNIKELIQNAADAIIKIWEALSSALKTIWEATWTAIQNAFNTVKDAIVAAIETFKDTMESLWNALTTNLKNAWDALWSGLIEGLTETLDTIRTTIEEGIQAAIDAIIAMLHQFVQAGQDIVNSIRDGITETWINITTAISTGLTAIGTFITGQLEAIKAWGANIVEGIRTGLEDAWETIVTAVGTLLTNLGGMLAAGGTLVDRVIAWGTNIVTAIRDGIVDAWTTITTGLGTLLTSMVGDKTIWEKIRDAGGQIVDYLKKGIDNAWEAFITWVKNKIIDWFGGSEPKDTTSPFHSRYLVPRGEEMMERLMQGVMNIMPTMTHEIQASMNAMQPGPTLMPALAPSNTDNSRTITVEVNPTYMGTQSVDEIYYDISAALAAVQL